MPIPKNWVEELAAEWLALEGFLVETNVRLSAHAGGGVDEADVIGVRTDDSGGHIVHIETGQLVSSYSTNLKTVTDKFSDSRKQVVQSICRERIIWPGEAAYKCYYISDFAGSPEKLRIALEDTRIAFVPLQEFIIDHVLPTILRWKQQQQTSGRRKTTETTLPDCYWLMKLLDYLHQHHKLNI